MTFRDICVTRKGNKQLADETAIVLLLNSRNWGHTSVCDLRYVAQETDGANNLKKKSLLRVIQILSCVERAMLRSLCSSAHREQCFRFGVQTFNVQRSALSTVRQIPNAKLRTVRESLDPEPWKNLTDCPVSGPR